MLSLPLALFVIAALVGSGVLTISYLFPPGKS